jgi:hypothetical protein
VTNQSLEGSRLAVLISTCGRVAIDAFEIRANPFRTNHKENGLCYSCMHLVLFAA